MKTKHIICLVIFTGLLCSYNISFADFYKYVDDKNELRITNVYDSEPCKKYGCKLFFKEVIAPEYDVATTDWKPYTSSDNENMHYAKGTIKKVNNNIISVWTQETFFGDRQRKAKAFASLKSTNKAANNPDTLVLELRLQEIDCVNKKSRIISANIYDEKGSAFTSLPKSAYQWSSILPNSQMETLRKIVCGSSKTSKTKK